MTNFKELMLDDKEIFSKYLGDYNFNTYEYTFLTLYIWRKMLNVEFSFIYDALIIKKSTPKTGTYFMQPIGYKKENLKDIVLKLADIRKAEEESKNLFRDIEKPFLHELLDIFQERISYCEDKNNFDYIYKCEDMAALSGKKFHRKRNRYNLFISSYVYEVKDINYTGVIRDCIDISRKWFAERGQDDGYLKFELEAIEDTLPKADLLGMMGIAVYIDGKIAGFTAGEKANNNMGIVHFQKANPSYNGIYEFMNKAFVERYLSGVEFINLQEDMGIKGLRKAKSAYNPVKLEKKYIADLL